METKLTAPTQSLQNVLAHATSLNEGTRRAYLKRVASDSPNLISQAEDALLQFLKSEADTDAFVGVLQELAGYVHQKTIPQFIGPYQILGLLGAGGMGRVYSAFQQKPLKRLVAIKVTEVSGSQERSRRFAQECQALARLSHPNLIQIYDVGQTDQQHLYFTMEHFDGQPIHQYCAQHQVDLKGRMALMLQICEGIRHAHQKGILHRDLKPSNVLVKSVQGKPLVKVIDFGIARLTVEEPLTGDQWLTNQGAVLGTLAYLCPDQIAAPNELPDVRLDVYGLGAILYQLLCNTPPHDSQYMESLPLEAALRHIRTHIPTKPSKQCQQAPESNQNHPQPGWVAALKKEPDWICMKALSPDRAQRYPSVAEFEQDIKNYLAQKVVEAAPISQTYRLKKLLQRHQIGFAALGLVVLAFVTSLISISLSWAEAERNRIKAQQAAHESNLQANKYQRLFEFLSGLLAAPNPYSSSKDTKVIDLLEQAEVQIPQVFEQDPAGRAVLYKLLGLTYLELGHLSKAEKYRREALQTQVDIYGPSHPATMENRFLLAEFLVDESRFQEASTEIATLEQLLQKHPNDLYEIKTARIKLIVKTKTESPRESISLWRAHLAALENRGDNQDDMVFEYWKAMREMGLAHVLSGQPEKAITTYAQVLDILHHHYPNNHLVILRTHNFMALAYTENGQLDQSITLFQELLEDYTANVGPRHRETAMVERNLARALIKNGQYPEAQEHLEHALSVISSLPENNSLVLQTRNLQAIAFQEQGSYRQAIGIYRDLWLQRKNAEGEQELLALRFANNLSFALILAGQPLEALPLIEKVLNSYRDKLGPNAYETINAKYVLARAQLAGKQLKQASKLFQETFETCRTHYPQRQMDLAVFEGYAAYTRALQGDPTAQTTLKKCIALLHQMRSPFANELQNLESSLH